MNTPVSFELSKLLKEKDFKEHVNNYFGNNGREEHFQHNYKANYNSALMVGLTHSRPTIADVVMWLYRNHKIWINCIPIDSTHTLWEFQVSKKELGLMFSSGQYPPKYYSSPEEAYESAIEWVLNELL
jgi:hypothetical protein